MWREAAKVSPMTNANETTETLNANVASLIAEIEAALVEIEGEDKGKRYQRVRRLSERLENAKMGHAPWSLEAKALGAAVGRVFKFRAWGSK